MKETADPKDAVELLKLGISLTHAEIIALPFDVLARHVVGVMVPGHDLDKGMLASLEHLLDTEAYVPVTLIQPAMFAQRLVVGLVVLTDIAGAADGLSEEEQAAHLPHICRVTRETGWQRDPDSGTFERIRQATVIGRGKSALQALFRGIVWLTDGRGRWDLTRSNAPDSACWMSWRGHRWAMDAQITVRADYLPDVPLQWMDPSAVTGESLNEMTAGEMVPLELVALTTDYAVFTAPDGERLIGPATLAFEWRGLRWSLLRNGVHRLAVVTNAIDEPVAYVSPMNSEKVLEEEASSDSYTSAGGMSWRWLDVAQRWAGEAVGAVVHREESGWWSSDLGPNSSPRKAMDAANPG